MGFINTRIDIKKKRTQIVKPLVNFLDRLGVTPNMLTIIGFIFSLISVFFLFENHLLFFLFNFLHSVMDNLDGDLARASGKVTNTGIILDHTLDHIGALIIMCKTYYVFGDWISLAAIVTSVIHILFAHKDSWESYLAPSSSSILKLTYWFKQFRLGMIIQTVYSVIALPLYYVLEKFKKV